MNYYGTFNEYTPTSFPQGFPSEMRGRAVWLRNEFDEDIYEVRTRLPPGHTFVTAEADGSLRVVHDDPHQVWPANGGALYGTPEAVPMDPAVLMTKRFDYSTRQIVDKPAEVPKAVTRAQALMALYNAGKLDALEAKIAAHPYRPVRIWFENANEWLRANPYVNLLGPELGLTDEDIDALFTEAARL